MLIVGFGTGIFALSQLRGFSEDARGFRGPGLQFWQSFGIFTGPFLVGVIVSAVMLIIAEGIKLGLNIEDHLFNIRNKDKPLSDIRRRLREIETARRMRENWWRMLLGLAAAAKTGAQVMGEAARSGAQAAGQAIEEERQKRRQAAQPPPRPRALPSPAAADDLDLGDLDLDDLSDLDDAPVTPPSRPTAPAVPSVTQEMLRQNPEQILVTADTQGAKTAFQRGLKLYQEKKFVTAIPHLDEAVRLDPNYANAYGCRAECYKELGEMERYKADRAAYLRLRNGGKS
jgi:tetratricopeptide (TPR) repeat protein